MADKYGLKVNQLIVKIKVCLTNIAFSVMPGKMISIMSDATNEYVEKLKPLPDLGKEEDIPFFEYVIAQEEAQARALRHASNENYLEAARELNDFLALQLSKTKK